MPEKSIPQTEEVYRYVLEHGHNRDPIRQQIEQENAKLAGWLPCMQTAAEEATLLGLLVRTIGAKSALEVGTFTGYSSLIVARALPPDGHLLCCDVNEQWTSIAKRYWEQAGVADKITLKLGPALATLKALPASTVFDFSFIDANKDDYCAYYEEALKHTRPNGLILIDNVLWSGRIFDRADQDRETIGVREINELVARDTRVEAVMLPFADGLTIARKK
ncbi:MAG TPA: class I SAM-dependent methyltransferase [Candidatus Binataceae bacterium]|nr:class I SAM-dependent methyltransferase [Candidatus Binataceae bacterium]